jgi:uncharacterized protein (TIGR02145 family)
MRKALLIVSVAVFGLSYGGGEQAVSTFTDKRDGKVYRIVEIDGRVWFAENLNYAAEGSRCYGESGVVILVWYKNGDYVTTTLSAAEVQANCAKYGRLYDWETALKACPAGFHLPTADEWTALENAVGGQSTAGTKLKSAAGWNENGNGTNDFGWSALPGGYGDSNGSFNYAGSIGYWWSATEYVATTYARYRRIYYNYEDVYWGNANKKSLFSVRCVQNKEGEQ